MPRCHLILWLRACYRLYSLRTFSSIPHQGFPLSQVPEDLVAPHGRHWNTIVSLCDGFGDFDEELNKLIKPEALSREASLDPDTLLPPTRGPPSSSSQASSSSGPTPSRPAVAKQDQGRIPDADSAMDVKWASHMQLATFRATASKIAEDYCKDR